MKWLIAIGSLFAVATVAYLVIWGVPAETTPEKSNKTFDNVVNLPTQLGAAWSDADNPEVDGWDTEAFQGEAKTQLKQLGKLFSHPDEIDSEHLTPLLMEEFRSDRLIPDPFPVVFENADLVVQRWRANETAIPKSDLPLVGVEGLVTALKSLVVPFQKEGESPSSIQSEFKIYRVKSLESGEMETRQLVSLVGSNSVNRTEQHSDWLARWSIQPDGKPRLVALQPMSIEQTKGARSTGLFTDVTAATFGENSTRDRQFLLGLDHWFERVQDQRYSAFIGVSGVTVGDVNNDGLDDLYVCQETGLPNRLFLQQANGTLQDGSVEWGVDWLQTSRSSLLVDLDNDGDQDLVIAIMGGLLLAENTGARFVVKTILPTTDDTTSVSAADYDLDGRLDLYVCTNFSNSSLGNELPSDSADFVIHDANDGGSNSLFHNEISEGNWDFKDVTTEIGLDENNRKYSWAAAWEDYDNDGDLDLYVANDFGRDNLYRNDQVDGEIQFSDVAESAEVENAASGMSTSFGDFNRDGLMDIFISNMFSSAGNRIAFQEQFKPDAPAEVRDRMARLARGNTLLKNMGDGSFEDVSGAAGIEMGRWAWGSMFFDLDNDGWEDLMVSNGFVTTDDTGDL
ncbi:MAG: VCBS repeat-containing protein [Mariniblastus sp.]|nr:VCBS repeat-containing protein [Mariniblastus sp.]